MGGAKKKRTIHARDIVVDNRKLDTVLLDLAELSKESATRSARLEEILAECAQRSARAEERSARAEEIAADAARRCARAEEMAEISLRSIAALTRDHLALAQRADERLGALEKAVAAE